MKYREKHIEIEAVQYDGRWLDLLRWLDRKGFSPQDARSTYGQLNNNNVTLKYDGGGGEVYVSTGEWVCLNDDLGVYVLPDDTFKMMFEPVAAGAEEETPSEDRIKIPGPAAPGTRVFGRRFA